MPTTSRETAAPAGGGATPAPSGGAATEAPSGGAATEAPSGGTAQTEAPVAGGTTQPPAATGQTGSPVAGGAGIVPLSTFTIEYQSEDTSIPDDAQCAEAEATTIMFLDEFLSNSFDFATDIDYQSLAAGAIDCSGSPLRITFEGTVMFDPNSMPMPTTMDLDLIVMTAFQQPAVETLLLMLRNLDSSPFSSVSNAIYSPATVTQPDALPHDEATTGGDPISPELSPSSDQADTLSHMFVFMMVAAVAFLFAMVLYLSYRSISPKTAFSRVPEDPLDRNIMSFRDGDDEEMAKWSTKRLRRGADRSSSSRTKPTSHSSSGTRTSDDEASRDSYWEDKTNSTNAPSLIATNDADSVSRDLSTMPSNGNAARTKKPLWSSLGQASTATSRIKTSDRRKEEIITFLFSDSDDDEADDNMTSYTDPLVMYPTLTRR
jgi:hypothetical protein